MRSHRRLMLQRAKHMNEIKRKRNQGMATSVNSAVISTEADISHVGAYNRNEELGLLERDIMELNSNVPNSMHEDTLKNIGDNSRENNINDSITNNNINDNIGDNNRDININDNIGYNSRDNNSNQYQDQHKKDDLHENTIIEGRRIVNISHFYSELQRVANHGPMDCGLMSVELLSEKRDGLFSKYTLKCRMCNEKFVVRSEPPVTTNITVNHCAVAGTMAIGNGHRQLEEFSAALNLPMITPKLYKTCHSKIQEHFEKVSFETMSEAAAIERKLALDDNRVDKNGIPLIDVIVDGCWSKRTYKKNYSALSGAAAIIGRKTGKVLFLGIRNKYCSICSVAASKNQNAKEHKCYKNFDGPSTAMESDILVEGFKHSVSMHNLIYARMISDGDSSTHSKLLKSRPYPNLSIEKIECRNHILRNLCNKLTALQTDTKYILRFRKMLTAKRIMIIRKTIREIIRKYKTDSEDERRLNVSLLYNDLLLAHYHAFEDHTRCKSSFCKSTEQSSNVNNDLFTNSFWHRICSIMSNVAAHASSLIHDVDSNVVECFNSIVAKMVGGKRINYSQRGSYQARCHAAVISHNTHKVLSSMHKSISGHSPKGYLKKLEGTRIQKILRNRNANKTKRRRLQFIKSQGDINYGENCEKPDMATDIFEKEKDTFLSNLRKSATERVRIERDTVLQSSCSEWLELRRSLITASNFGKVIKRRTNISCANLVKDLVYKNSLGHVRSIKHGRDNEKRALEQLSKQENVEIRPCGLFIDEDIQYLGATPDGLIGGDTIVEIKCPISAYKMTIQEAVKNKKIPFLKVDNQGNISINKMHSWYYQVQGQLHITKRSKCLFAIWTDEELPLWIHAIFKDDDFWVQEMAEKLVTFYRECLLPELVDPRLPRNQPIRDPQYIIDAINQAQLKKNRKRKSEITHTTHPNHGEEALEGENDFTTAEDIRETDYLEGIHNLQDEENAPVSDMEMSSAHEYPINVEAYSEEMPSTSRRLCFDEF